MDWPTLQASFDILSDYTAISHCIIISAWTTRLQFLACIPEDEGFADSQARVELEDGGYLLWEFDATTKEEFPPHKEYLGIHLIDHEPELDSKRALFRGPALLVVSKVEGRMERVRFGWVTHYKYKLHSADGVWEHADCEGLATWSENRPRLVKAWQEIRLG